jgi:hypothetical protein
VKTKTRTILTKQFVFIISLLVTGTIQAGTLAGYDFDADTSDLSEATMVATNMTASQFSSPMDIAFEVTSGDNSGVDAEGDVFGSASTLGGVGIQVIDATTSSFDAAVAGDDYVTFTVTPDDACVLNLTSLSFKVTKKATTSVDEYAVTDADGNLIGSAVVINNVVGLIGTYDSVTVDLSAAEFQSLSEATEFRIYAWGRGTAATSNTLAVMDKVVLKGSVVQLGERADWLRGKWGPCWLPEYYQNGTIEGVSIKPFLAQFSDFKTIGFVQVKLTDGSYFSTVHTSPNKILESFWHDNLTDRDANGEPIKNLVVPRWIDEDENGQPDSDPLKEWLTDIKTAGLRTQVYVNSGNVLRTSIPPSFGDVTDRWIEWCDTNEVAQAFINSEPYHSLAYDWDTGDYTDTNFTTRAYMFCYAEFILKDYAIRYGDLVDSWIFDQATMITGKGDTGANGSLLDQRIYEAFAAAVHAGNPNAAVAFNNGPNRDDGDTNPYTHATRFCDYMFGHPYGGNNDHASKATGLYYENYRFVQWNTDTSGYVHKDDPDYADIEDRVWDDKVVGHLYPKMAKESWNGGSQAFEDEDFNQWNREMTQAGGSFAWGVPLNRADCSNVYGPYLTAKPWAIDQLTQMDEHLSHYQWPGAPNWARSETLLSEATIGQSYYHDLVEGVDLWDPEGDEITSVEVVGGTPSWLTIAEDPNNEGHWLLSGIPTETSATTLTFTLRAADASGSRDREVELVVNESSTDFAGNVLEWVADPLVIADAYKYQPYTYYLMRGRDFEGPAGSDLTLTKTGGANWISLTKMVSGVWKLSGIPFSQDGLNSVELSLSDGSSIATATIQLTVTDAQYLDMINQSIQKGFWTTYGPIAENDEWTYNGNGGNYYYRGLLYSEKAYQSSGGFRLTVDYTIGTIGDSGSHSLSFGLISTETDPTTYEGYNPFRTDTTVYSLGVNLTAEGGTEKRGLNFTDGSTCTTLDQSGDNVEFVAGSSTPVVIEILPDGAWSYSINGTVEATGVISDGFDLSKTYRVVVYGQDDNGSKTIQSVAVDLLEETDLSASTVKAVSVSEDSSIEMVWRESDELTYSLLSQPEHGTLSGTLPMLTYTPEADYNGSDSFTYQVSDGSVDSTVTVNISVMPVNDTPTADEASMSTDEDESASITLTGSDIDDGDSLAAVISTEPTNGTVSVTGTVVTYTPNANYNGLDGFTYVMNDGTDNSAAAAVSVTVNSIDDAPIFDIDPVVGAFAVQDILYSGKISATDVDSGDTFTYSKDAGADWLEVNEDGSLGGTPAESDLGLNVFTITATETADLFATVTLEIVVLEPDVLVYYDSFENGVIGTNPDMGGGAATIGTDSGDYWGESGGELVYVSDGSGGNRSDGYSINSFALTNGFSLEVAYDIESLIVSANNQFSFGLIAGYTPDHENSFTVTNMNATGIGFNVGPGNSGDDQGLILAEGGEIGSTLTNLSELVSDSGEHTLYLTLTPDGVGGANWSYSYDGGTEVSGTIATFDFETNTYAFVSHARDITVDKSIQHVKLVAMPERIFYARSQQVDTLRDMPVSIMLESYDSKGSNLLYSVDSQPTNGTLSGTAPDLIYTPDSWYTGEDSFTFVVSDGETFSAPTTVTITVEPSDAGIIEYSFEAPGNIEGTTSSIVYSAPDLNSFGTGVTVSSVELSDAETPDSLYGRIEDLGGGSVEAAVTDRGTAGTIAFTLMIDDTVSVNLTNITFGTSYRTTLTGDTTANWSFSTVVGENAGNAESGSFTHDGGDNYQSPASASSDIALSGLTGLTDTTVTFTWVLDGTRVNSFESAAIGLDDIVLEGEVLSTDTQPPVADSISVLTGVNIPLTITLTGSDPEGSSLTYNLESLPTNGTLSGSAPALIYTPTNGFTGEDSFTFTVSDGLVTSDPAIVSITVVPSNARVSIRTVGDGSGYDIIGTEVSSYYTTSIEKNFDVGDEDNRYGSDGYYVFGGSGEKNSANYNTAGAFVVSNAWFIGPITADVDNTLVRNNSSQTDIDNPTFTDGTDFGNSGYLMNSGTAGTTNLPMLQFSVTNSQAMSFRFGVLAGSEDQEKFDPSALHLSFDDSDASATDPSTTIAALEYFDGTDPSTDIGMVFFDVIIDEGASGTFTLAASQNGGDNPTIAGVTFDVIQGVETPIKSFVIGSIVSSTEVALSWMAVDGESYGVESTTNLVDGPWIEMTNGISGNDAMISITNSILDKQVFYRVYLEE